MPCYWPTSTVFHGLRFPYFDSPLLTLTRLCCWIHLFSSSIGKQTTTGDLVAIHQFLCGVPSPNHWGSSLLGSKNRHEIILGLLSEKYHASNCLSVYTLQSTPPQQSSDAYYTPMMYLLLMCLLTSNWISKQAGLRKSFGKHLPDERSIYSLG